MLQVRWNLKPTTTKDKKTLAATFNPIKERFKAHRDFDLHAHEIAPKKARTSKASGSQSQSKEGSTAKSSKAKVTKQSSDVSLADSATDSATDPASSSDNQSDNGSVEADIGILDFDGCDELGYDLDLHTCFPFDGDGDGELVVPDASDATPLAKLDARDVFISASFMPTSFENSFAPEPLLKELEGLYQIAESGVLVVSEQEVMDLAQDDAAFLIEKSV